MLFRKRDDTPKTVYPPIDPFRAYQGNGFTIRQPEGWEDKTIHTIYGPVKDSIQHNIIITVEENVNCNSLTDYAEIQISSLEQQLTGCRLLKREKITMENNTPAYKVVFRWEPINQSRIYQEQLYIIVGSKAYKITTSFSRKTRKTLGPEIERIMFSFQNT